MRVAKITRRSKVPSEHDFGIEQGKLYVGDQYEDGGYRERFVSGKSKLLDNSPTVIDTIIHTPSSILVSVNNTHVDYSLLSGISSDDYVFKFGSNRGQRLFQRNGLLLDEKDNVVYNTVFTGITGSFARTTARSFSATLYKVIHETELEFVLYVNSTNSSALIIVQKSNYSSTVIFTGQFSVHRLGKTRADNTYPEFELFFVLANSMCCTPYSTRINWSHWGNNTWLNGAKAYLFGFIRTGSIMSAQQGVRVRQFLSFGVGPAGYYQNTWQYAQASRNQRFLIDGDSSIVELDDEGYVLGFGFVSQNPITTSTEAYISHSGNTNKIIKLNDNLSFFRCVVNAALDVTLSSTKLTLPEEYLTAEWILFGDQNTASAHDCITLISGKSFIVKEEETQFLCLIMDNVGFEFYQNQTAAISSSYQRRISPNLPPVLMRIPVDASLNIIGEPIVTKFPVRFGEFIRSCVYFTRKENKELIVPSTFNYPVSNGTLDNPTGNSYLGVKNKNYLASINVMTGEYETIFIGSYPHTEISTSNLNLQSMGVTDDRILVRTAYSEFLVVDDGPNVEISLVEPVHSGTTSVHVKVQYPAVVELKAVFGRFDNGADSITVTVDDSATIPVTTELNTEVHVVSCVRLELEHEEV